MPLLRRDDHPDPHAGGTDAPPHEQWEYKAMNLNWKASVAFENEFNKLGRQGWEFVAVAERDKVHRAIFKRRRAVT